jgi:putative SOS response-associated peptidase YedK
MCNLYSLTRSQDAIRQLTKAMRDTTGNMPPLPGIFPDTLAPVVRTARDGARAHDDEMGIPATAQLGYTTRHERPQRQEPVLARVAKAGIQVLGAGDELLRMDRRQAKGNALVCSR